jgi:hypothetical protein
MFGQEAGIFGYEVDGLDYTFRDGLPYPVPVEGQPEDINVLAMAPAMFAEDEIEGPGYYYYVRDSDYSGAVAIVDEPEEEARRRYRYGCGMIVHMPKGAGEVFTAGSCEWVNGLSLREPFTCAVTRNVLTRFSASDK